MVMTVEERKAKKKAYMVKYNAKSSVKASKAQWLLDNKESHKVSKLKYRSIPENKEKIALSKRKYKLENKEKISIWRANYRVENQPKLNARGAKYRSKKLGATVCMTKEDKAKIAELYEIARNATKLFGYGWEVDHIVPLNKGGLHKLSNLQVVPGSWNSAKGDRSCDTYWD